MKRGMVSDTMLIVGSIIVLGLLFILGIKFITNINENARGAAMAKFENKLKSDIAAIKTKDSLRSYEYTLPSDIERICFVDNDVDKDALSEHPLIRTHVEDGAKNNVFIYTKEDFSSIYISGVGVYVYPFFACYDIEGQTLNLRMQGKANTAMLIPPADVEMCTIAEDMAKCDWLVVFYADYRTECCRDYSKCC